METDQFDAVLRTVEKALNGLEKAADAEVENAVKAFANAHAEACLLGDNGSVIVTAYLPDYEGQFIEHGGFKPLGSFEAMIASEAEIVAEGDIGWGEQLREVLVQAVAQIDAALIEGRRQSTE